MASVPELGRKGLKRGGGPGCVIQFPLVSCYDSKTLIDKLMSFSSG